MHRHSIYSLPSPPPADTVLIGPPDWRVSGADGAPLAPLPGFSELLASLGGAGPTAPSARDAAAADGPAEAPASPCVLLHGEHLGLPGSVAEVAAALRDLTAARPDVLAVLLCRSLDVAAGADLFQAGLFAALPVPLDAGRWAATVARVAQRREGRSQTQALRAQGEETLRRLHAHRRRLQDQVATIGEELIHSQRRLEQANAELTEHMTQLSLLYKFGRELSAARNWDAALAGLLEGLARFLGARGAALVLRAAPDAPYTPRQTFGWEEAAWEKILLRIDERIGGEVAAAIGPGVYRLGDGGAPARSERAVTALPLEHQGWRLGYLLLLDCAAAGEPGGRALPFLQAVQVILAEEVAGAQMLDRIRELGAFNARVLETVRSGIWVCDEQGRTLYCNRAGRRLLTGRDDEPPAAYDAAWRIGRGRSPAGESAPPDVFRRAREGALPPELFLDGCLRLPDLGAGVFARLFARGDEPYLGEGRIVRAGAEGIPVLVQTSLMPGRGRDERWLVLVAEDLRETKKAEAERSRADSLQGMVELSAALAHEIRNPLMGLSAQAELLAGHLPADDPRRRYLDVITAEVARIDGTITRLLSFVRPYEPRLAPASLLALARDCLDLVRSRAEAKGVVARLSPAPAGLPDAAWEQTVDGGQIKQVLLNLLLNALDAAPAGTAVDLRLRREARLELADAASGGTHWAAGVALEVADRGPGFAPADAERLFRPFFTTKSAGTGLGLSISRKIVAAHGGEIRALRRGDETVFQVLLPARAGSPARAAAEEAR